MNYCINCGEMEPRHRDACPHYVPPVKYDNPAEKPMTVTDWRELAMLCTSKAQTFNEVLMSYRKHWEALAEKCQLRCKAAHEGRCVP